MNVDVLPIHLSQIYQMNYCLLFQDHLPWVTPHDLPAKNEPNSLDLEVLGGSSETVELGCLYRWRDVQDFTVFFTVANVDLHLFAWHQ
jgi:hypothetical protein